VTYSRERRPFARPIQPIPGVAGLAAISSERKRKATPGEKPLKRSAWCSLTFFVISLLTNILGPTVPDIISSFHVSLTAAGFLAFAFFIAYGVMSIPAGGKDEPTAPIKLNVFEKGAGSRRKTRQKLAAG